MTKVDIEFVNNHTIANYDTVVDDEFFKKYTEKNGRTRVVEWGGGTLYSSPGNVVGIILRSEFDASSWTTSLSWNGQHKNKDALCVYKKGNDEKYWCIRNEHLEYVRGFTGKKEITLKYNSHKQVGIVEYGRWVFVIAPAYVKESDLHLWDNIRLTEMSSVSLDGLW